MLVGERIPDALTLLVPGGRGSVFELRSFRRPRLWLCWLGGVWAVSGGVGSFGRAAGLLVGLGRAGWLLGLVWGLGLAWRVRRAALLPAGALLMAVPPLWGRRTLNFLVSELCFSNL